MPWSLLDLEKEFTLQKQLTLFRLINVLQDYDTTDCYTMNCYDSR